MTEVDGFLVAPCAHCGREALCARDLEPDGNVVLVCVHCDERLDPAAAYSVNTKDLAALGYDAGDDGHPHGERGCRDGQCGVRQPDA